MKQIYPDFYPQFHCLAGGCPDTCCKDWEVVVDEDAMAFYRTVTGELGQRLKDAFSVQDGETCFRLGDDGKCVLLTEDGLCPLQAQFGEKGLCRICASHPRFLEEYGAVQEITLCVSCPEAARLLLEHPEPVSFLTQETHEAVTTPNALDPTLYFAVRAFRDAAITLAQDRRRSVCDRLALVLLMAARAQTLLSAGKPEAVAPLCTRFLTHGTQERQLLRLRRMRRENAAFFPLWLLLRNMEHLTARLPALLDDCAHAVRPDAAFWEGYASRLENLSVYFLFRMCVSYPRRDPSVPALGRSLARGLPDALRALFQRGRALRGESGASLSRPSARCAARRAAAFPALILYNMSISKSRGVRTCCAYCGLGFF